MAILAQSRYVQGTVVRVPDSSGTYNLTVLRTVPVAQSAYRLYTWAAGDRPDIVAYQQFGNASLWWAIFDMNPEIIYPLGVPAGTVVRIPVNPILGQGTLIQ